MLLIITTLLMLFLSSTTKLLLLHDIVMVQSLILSYRSVPESPVSKSRKQNVSFFVGGLLKTMLASSVAISAPPAALVLSLGLDLHQDPSKFQVAF